MKEETLPFFLMRCKEKGDYSKNVKIKEVMFSFFLMSIRREGIIPKMSK